MNDQLEAKTVRERMLTLYNVTWRSEFRLDTDAYIRKIKGSCPNLSPLDLRILRSIANDVAWAMSTSGRFV